MAAKLSSLNPYFNGIYFLILISFETLRNIQRSLNPYFNGIYFLMELEAKKKQLEEAVLILILMEYTF